MRKRKYITIFIIILVAICVGIHFVCALTLKSNSICYVKKYKNNFLMVEYYFLKDNDNIINCYEVNNTFPFIIDKISIKNITDLEQLFITNIRALYVDSKNSTKIYDGNRNKEIDRYRLQKLLFKYEYSDYFSNGVNDSFNKFIQYEGENKSASDVRNLINTVLSNNRTNTNLITIKDISGNYLVGNTEGEKIGEIKSKLNTIEDYTNINTDNLKFLDTYKTYNIKMEISEKGENEGFINKIIIEGKEKLSKGLNSAFESFANHEINGTQVKTLVESFVYTNNTSESAINHIVTVKTNNGDYIVGNAEGEATNGIGSKLNNIEIYKLQPNLSTIDENKKYQVILEYSNEKENEGYVNKIIITEK